MTKDKSSARHVPTSGAMETIAAIKDPVLRNLKITLAYHDITLTMADRLGTKDLTWCAFGCWASKTAGFFIRGDETPAFAKALLGDIRRTLAEKRLLAPLNTLFGGEAGAEPLLLAVLRRAIDEVAAEIALGNLLVFQEIGLWFARMIEVFHGDTRPDAGKLARFLSAMNPAPAAEGGQGLLIDAFTNYHAALFEPDPKKRAELICLANAQTGYQEQTRVQPRVKGGLEAPIAALFTGAVPENFFEDPLEVLKEQIATSVAHLIGQAAACAQDTWRRMSTRWLMRLHLPEVILDLGRDLPALPSGKSFPSDLEVIENRELGALLYRLDRSPNSLVGTAAVDWGELGDRMHYIVDLFRSRQQDASLLGAPFTPTQIAVIRRGAVPEGSL